MNLRNLAIWGVIVVVLIGLYSMVTGGGQKGANAGEITYSQMLSKVDAGEIRTAEFRQGGVDTSYLERHVAAAAPDGSRA